ncbi:sensor histidine kinase [Gracilibacillus boraciitolerans JCM 21714]|uniref:histidine kinase n=2 Tax=Gracilibacillus boraciitolerans TaxID=307521 RepID=W4VPS7_9BACI|nr:sensor histidine kinase [Gracilibacillus boraciitolerans JCM 21714]
MYVLCSFILAGLTGIVLMPGLWYLEENSRFFESLLFILSYFRVLILVTFYIITSILYLLLFYQYERKRYLTFMITKITEDIQRLDSEEQLSTDLFIQSEFKELAEGIKRIITNSQIAIDEVKQAEQLKNDLVTNVAHDLRSPLTSIIGYLELINDDQYRDEVELRNFVQVIHDKASSLNTLINDILNIRICKISRLNFKRNRFILKKCLIN